MRIKLTQDQLELHNAFVGLNEQVKYIEWLCRQLGYIKPSDSPQMPHKEELKNECQ